MIHSFEPPVQETLKHNTQNKPTIRQCTTKTLLQLKTAAVHNESIINMPKQIACGK